MEDDETKPDPRDPDDEGTDELDELPAPPRTVALDDDQVAERDRLLAKLGFIPEDEAKPRLIGGRYEVLKTVGSGGMGVVYQVRDTELDSQDVALKLVQRGRLRDVEGAHARLREEARQMARLRNQEHVVTVHDVGQDGDATYLTMELVKGTDLRRWRARAEPSQTEILRAYLGAARGLQAAHDEGIIHRDFKPDNVLLDAGGRAKVADFGIAAAAAEPIEDLGAEDSSGELTKIRGTILYMSPEHMRGERPNERSDQFSFCVALWETLTGELPYTWRDVDSQEAALRGPPARAKKLPIWLRRVLCKGMSAKRSERFGDMQELIDVIEHKLARPRRLKIAGAGVGVLLLLSLVGRAAWAAMQPPAPEPTCSPFVEQIEAHWGPEQRGALERRRPRAPEGVDWALAKLDELAAEWAGAAKAQCVEGEAPSIDDPERECLENWLATFDQAVEMLTEHGDERTLVEAPELLLQLEAPEGEYCAVRRNVDDPQLSRLIDRAKSAVALGDLGLADSISEAAVERASAISKDGYLGGAAHAHALRGEVLFLLERPQEGDAEFRRAEAHAMGSYEPGILAELRVNWAKNLALHAEAAEEALDHLGRVEPLFVAANLPRRSSLAGELSEARAQAELRLENFDRAEEYFNEALGIFTAMDNHLLEARAISNRGTLHHTQAQRAIIAGDTGPAAKALEAAEADYRRAIEIYVEEDVAPGYPRLLNVRFDLGLVLLDRYYVLNDPNRADAMASEALFEFEEVLEHADADLELTTLGVACQFASDADQLDELKQLISRGDRALAAAGQVAPATRDAVEAQVALAALISLGDSSAEDRVRTLLERGAELDPGLYWAIARSWIEHLERSERCEEAETAVAQLDGSLDELEGVAAWKAARPGGACS